METNVDYQKLLNQRDALNRKTEEYSAKLDLVNSQIEKTNKKISDNIENQSRLNEEVAKMEKRLKLPNVEINKIGNSISAVAKKIAKWTLALFGVRAMYGFIRQAVSQVANYNDKIAGKLEAIKVVVATALEPMITKIIDLLYTGLAYIIPMLNSWLKMDILAEAQANSLKKSNKNAKQLQKTLAGFDEMNIINKDGTVGGIGNTIVAIKDLQKRVNEIQESANSLDFSKINFGNTLAILGSIAAILGVAGGGILGTLSLLVASPWVIKVAYDSVKKLKEENAKNLESVKALKRESEFLSTIQNKSINDLIEKYRKGEATIDDVRIGIENMKDSIMRNEGAKKSTDELNSKVGFLEGILTNNKKVYSDTSKAMVEKNYENIASLYALQKELGFTGEDIDSLAQNIKNEIIWLSDLNLDLDTNSEEYKTNSKKIEILLGYLDNLRESTKKRIEDLEKDNEGLKKNSKKYQENREEIEKLKGQLEKIDGLKYAAELKIEANLDTQKADKDFSSWTTKVGKKLASTLAEISAGGGGGGRSGGRGFAKGGIVYPSELPRLASGGIINQPGRGVPLASAIGGERRAEGVLPLTDSQQMELLGQAIGRYITINANITNTMNGRVISRELQKLQNNSDFAMNR